MRTQENQYPTVDEWVAAQLPKLLNTIPETTWDELWEILQDAA